jgi:C4-dicarboxylate transporter, DctM subunit
MMTAYHLAYRGYPTEGAFSFARVIDTGKDAAHAADAADPDPGRHPGRNLHRDRGGRGRRLLVDRLAAFLYRTISWASFLIDTFRIAGKRSAMLMFIVATSTLLGWYLTNQRIPQEIARRSWAYRTITGSCCWRSTSSSCWRAPSSTARPRS